MSLRDTIVEKFRSEVEKQNPWMPYRGEAGGQGWQNMITGEIRYQDARPAPEEGMPEDHEGEVPTPDEDPGDRLSDELESVEGIEPGTHLMVDADDYDEYEGSGEVVMELEDGYVVETPNGEEISVGYDEILGEVNPPEPSDIAEYLEEGMTVTADLPGTGDTEVEVLGISDSGKINVDTADGPILLNPEDIVEHPVELEPTDGWADGWTDGPDELSDLESGQTVEFYNLETGEYRQGEISHVEADDPDFEGDYVSIHPEDGAGVIEIAPGIDAGDEYIITAQEDQGDDLVEIDSINALEEGDRFFARMQDDESLVENFYGAYGGEEGELVEFVVEEAHNSSLTVRSLENGETGAMASTHFGSDYSEVFAEPAKFAELDSIPGVDPMDADATDWGMLTGAAVAVQTPAGEFEGELEHIKIDPEGYDWYAVGGAEGSSVTTNPDHPLYAGTAIEGAENPYEEPDVGHDFKIGDKLVHDGDVLEVDGTDVEEGELLLTNGEWISEDEAVEWADEVQVNEPMDVPSDSPSSSWQTPVDIHDDGGVDFKPISEGSYVYYFDDEAGEMQIGEAADFTQDTDIELANGETIHRANVEGFALDEKDNVVSPGNITNGEQITVEESDGSEITGHVVDVDTYGSTEVQIVGEDGEMHTVKPGQPDQGIVGHDPDATYEPLAFDVDDDGTITDVRPTDEIIDDIKDRVDFTERDSKGRLNKTVELAKSQKQELKTEMYRQFGIDTVDDFWEYKGMWKGNSGQHAKAEVLERAYKKSLGIEAPARDNGGWEPSEEITKMAETVAEMSQDYFREVFGESETLARGSSDVAWTSFVQSFLEDPNRDEYRLSFLANNNHTTDFRGTADKWNAFTVEHDVEPSDILTMTDHLFETSYESELEIGVKGDGQTATLDGIKPGPKGHRARTESLSSDIESWNETQSSHFWRSMAESDMSYGSLGPGKLENLKRLVERFEELDPKTANTAARNEVDAATKALLDNDMPPETMSAGDGWDVEDFEGLSDETGYEMGQGIDAKVMTEFDGAVDGEIMGVAGGEIMVWSDQGGETSQEYGVEVDDILEMDEDEAEELTTQTTLPTGEEMRDQFSPDAAEFEPLDDVYYGFGDTTVDAGTITEIEDGMLTVSGPLGQSETFTLNEAEQGYVVPKETVDEASEGSADDGADWYGVGSADEIDEGEWVRIEPGVHGDDVIAQVSNIDEHGQIYIDEDSVDDTESGVSADQLDPYYYDSEIDEVSPNYGAASGSTGTGETGTDETSDPSDDQLGLEDYGLVTNQPVSWTDENGETVSGYAEYVEFGDDPEIIVEHEDEPYVLGLDPEDINEADVSDGSDDASADLQEQSFDEVASSYEQGETFYLDADHENYPKEVEFQETTGYDENDGINDKIMITDQEDGGTMSIDEEDVANGTFTFLDEEPEGSDDGGLPDWNETELVNGSPDWDDFEEGQLVVYEGDVWEVDEPPEGEISGLNLVDDDGTEAYVGQHDINEIVEPEGSDDEEMTGEDVVDHLEGASQEGIYFDIPENYDGEGVGEATAYVGGDVLYEAPDGGEYWIDEENVAENMVSVGEEPEGSGDDETDYSEEINDILDDLEPEDYEDDDSVTPPEEVQDVASTGEEFTVEIPGEGVTDVVVTEASVDPAYPATVETDSGEKYLIWDDGEVEHV